MKIKHGTPLESKDELEWHEVLPSWWDGETSVQGCAKDLQKHRVYNAESEFRQHYSDTIFNGIEDVQDYVYRLLDSSWVGNLWTLDKYPIIEMISDEKNYAFVRYNTMYFCRDVLRKTVVLHELAHILAKYFDVKAPPHGRFFARTMLELFGHEFGAGAKDCLREQYVKHEVRFGPEYQFTLNGKYVSISNA